MKEPVLVCWSGGKDSTMMLHEILSLGRYDVRALLTTMTEGYDRISMHGVRRELLDAQARRLGFPLEKVYITQKASNAEYEAKMEAVLTRYKSEGVRTVSFGDIFLEDLKRYREKNLAKIGMEGLFPIWKRDTTGLVGDFIRRGYKARLSCVDTNVLNASFAGRLIDQAFLDDLPASVDPCGENGEFHSFVFDGPIFNSPVPIVTGERLLRDRFCFIDLRPSVLVP